jgi:hypothetical protein
MSSSALRSAATAKAMHDGRRAYHQRGGAGGVAGGGCSGAGVVIGRGAVAGGCVVGAIDG